MTGAGPAGGSAGYFRSPAIRGETIVFTCEDDLWSVPADGGPAERLTAGVSEAGWPSISPDGELIAFVGADDGPAEIYVMPRSGGPARRLTYQAAACRVLGWHPRTGEIVYAGSAGQPPGFGTRLFAVPAGGGRPRVLPYGPASAISFGAQGRVAVGRSIADPARRKRYRGGAAGEIWLEQGDGRWQRLLAGLPGNLADPCWAGDRLYFISDHERIGNVYSVTADGSDLRGHSDHHDFYARALSTDGARLVYHAGADLHLLDPSHRSGGGGHPVDVHFASARPQRRPRSVPASGHLEHARLSPDGESLAVVSRGQVFSLGVWAGPVRTHGRAAGVRHRRAEWLADGRLVAVAADESAFERLVVLPAEGGPGQDLDLGDVGLITELAAAPTASRVAFATNRHQLWMLDCEPGEKPRLVDSSQHERIEDLAWSPDGRRLAYTFPTSIRTSAIKVAEAGGGEPFAVTEPVLIDSRPVFDPGGRYLYFLGQRDLTPELDQVQAGVGFPFGARPFAVTLRADEPPPFTPPPGRTPGPPPAPSAQIDQQGIDREGIERRVVAFPVPEGRYADLVALEDRVLLVSTPVAAPEPAPGRSGPDGRVLAVRLDGSQRPEELLDPLDELSASADGRALLGRWNDRLRVLPGDVDADDADEDHVVTHPAGRVTGWVDLDRVRVRIDPAAEWRQMFREAWRLQREGFWAPGLPGVPWDAVFELYRPLAERVATRRELSDLLWELQGELATSHAYEFGGQYRRPENGEQEQGFLGLEFADRTWQVEGLLIGDPWDAEATSPCLRPGADILPGDRLLAIDGRPLGPSGPGELLVGLAGREVELTIEGPGRPLRRTVVRAARQEGRARYLDWVAANRRQVRELSGGRLGYLHVPDMFASGYRDFVRGFLAELDREGLVVDVRFNGGGHTSPLLLDQLARRRSGFELGRWGGSLPYPAEAPAGPMVAVINEQTGSDAELLSHRFRALGLGPLVGRRTWGGVVATWPRHTLVDGTVTTQPEFRYFLDDVGDRLENRGVDPDVLVAAPPGPPPDLDPDLVAATRLLLDLTDPARRLTAAPEGAGAA